jgi:CheY-like chemotaxis protein/two-component sensor histidine kinase
VSKLEKAIYKISREDEAKSEFLAILAHELRNPLAPVLSSLELLKLKGVEAEEAPKLIHMMEGRVHTMARLLDDLLDISRISQKKFMLRKERVELAPVVESALATVEPLMASRKHTLTVSVPDIPLYLDADPVRLEQIIVNLLVNAGKYTEPGGVIRLKIAKNASRVSILVSDNGIGIAPEMLSNIFEPFLQVVQGKKSSAGLGIGLFLTRNLVEMHDGYIEARSRGKGTGSEFFVYLPLLRAGNKKALPVQNVPAAFTAGSVSQHTKDKKKLKVLLVDDNESAAVSLGKLLTLSGYEVALAYSGEKALELFPKLRPDAVILDIGLPDIEGYVVAERIREVKAGKDVLLIALTGFGQESDREKARVAGFDHHRTKPIGLAEILPLLKEIPR